MKSTMKSAFAIIAVALMIMVAVVPMVGVSTDGASGTEAIVDPTVSGTGVTIDVTVYDENGGAVTSGTTNLVKLTYKAGSSNYSMTAEVSSDIEFTAQEKEISNVVLTYVDKDGVAVPGYGTASLGTLTAGDYAATIAAGLKSEQLVFKFRNGTSNVMNALPEGATMSGSYDIYVNTTDDASTATVYKTKQSINSTGTTTVYYPVTASNVYVKVTSLSVSGTGMASGAITYTTPLTPVKIDDTLEVNENLIQVALNSAFNMESVILTVNSIATDGVTYKKISNEMWDGSSEYETAKFTTTSDVPTDASTVTISLTAPDGTTQTAGAVTISNSTFTFDTAESTNKAFFGNVYMYEDDYWQTGTLTIKFTTNSVNNRNAVVGENGEFFTFISQATTETKIKEMSFKSGSQTYSIEVPAEGQEIGFGAAQDVELDDSAYALVSGELELSQNNTYLMNLEQLTVTGAATFGSLSTGTLSNQFAFMAETGKNIVISDTGAKLYGDVSVVVGSNSTGLNITVEAKKITVKVADALGNAMVADDVTLSAFFTSTLTGLTDFQTTSVDGTYEAYVPANLMLNLCVVGIEATNYTFEEDPAFVEGATYKAYEAEYSVAFYKANGSDLTLTSGTDYNVYKATAYRNSLGSIVYDITGENLTDTFIAKASVIGVKESDIGTTPVDVVILVKQSSADTKAILKDVYLLNADSTGKISITASGDSLTGKLVRNDGVTGIAGIKAELYTTSSSDTPVDTTYTQADGSFTVYSDLAIGSGYVMKFTDGSGSYVFADSYNAYESSAKVTTYKPTKDIYRVSFVDADGNSIILADDDKVTIGGVEASSASTGSNYVVVKDAWTAKSGALAVTLENEGGDVLRSFQDHTLTAEELATGKITVVSNQSTYTFNVMDAAGNAIEGAEITIKKYVGDYALSTGETEATDEYGIATFLLPLVGETDLSTEYGYSVSSDDYKFATSVAKITALEIDVVSITGTKVVYFKDATGASIAIKPSTVNVYADGQAGPTATVSAGYFSFLATEGVEYTYERSTSMQMESQGPQQPSARVTSHSSRPRVWSTRMISQTRH